MTNLLYGLAEPESGTSDFNAMKFLWKRFMAGVWTAMPVQVMSVTNSGGVSAIGNVDIMPMVHQIDGFGNSTPHGTIHNANYIRVQGGANAIILDPQVGDIGIAIFAQRDMSKVKSSMQPSPPDSRRWFDPSDAIYLYSILTTNSQIPTQYVQFNTSGITVCSPNTITLQGNVHITGTTTGDNTATFQGTNVHTHTHSGVQTGSGNTGPPN